VLVALYWSMLLDDPPSTVVVAIPSAPPFGPMNRIPVEYVHVTSRYPLAVIVRELAAEWLPLESVPHVPFTATFPAVDS
jgi:hypothetical protein